MSHGEDVLPAVRVYFFVFSVTCLVFSYIFADGLWHHTGTFVAEMGVEAPSFLGVGKNIATAFLAVFLFAVLFIVSIGGMVMGWNLARRRIEETTNAWSWSSQYASAGLVLFLVGGHQLLASFPFRVCVSESRISDCWQMYGALGFPMEATAAIATVVWMPTIGMALMALAIFVRNK